MYISMVLNGPSEKKVIMSQKSFYYHAQEGSVVQFKVVKVVKNAPKFEGMSVVWY